MTAPHLLAHGARSHTSPLVALAALCLVAAGWGGTQAGADAATPVATAATGSPVTWLGDLSGQAPCPEGMTRSASLGGTHLETGIPQQRFNEGWANSTTGVAGRGARSTVSSSDTKDHFFLNWVTAPVGARTMVAMASRGTVASSNASRLQVNSVDLRVAANSTAWTGKVYDVTAATDDEAGRLGGWFEHTSSAGASAWWEVDNVQYYICRNAPVSRIAGADRYDTSARIAAAFPTGRPVVYLASGENFPDALGGAPLAARHDAPVVLTKRDSLPRHAAAALSRLRPNKVVVLGSTGAVSDTVATQAAGYTTSGQVERLEGRDRYGTSAAIAAQYPAGQPVVYVATGDTYPDALSGSARAGLAGAPLLLVREDSVPDPVVAELRRIRPARIVVLGGVGTINNDVTARLRWLTSTGQLERIAGDDRYETSALVAATFPGTVPAVYVATGLNFPDALSGGALGGWRGAPVMLTRPQGLPGSVAAEVTAQDAPAGVVLGGQLSVHSLVLDQLGWRVG